MRDTCDAEEIARQDVDPELHRQMLVAGLHQDSDLSITAQLQAEDKQHDAIKNNNDPSHAQWVHSCRTSA